MGSGLQPLRSPPAGSDEVGFSGFSGLALQLNPGTFLVGFFLFLIIFLHLFRESSLVLSGFNVLSVHICSLGNSLALDLFVYNNVNSMLGNTVDIQVCHGNIYGTSLF